MPKKCHKAVHPFVLFKNHIWNINNTTNDALRILTNYPHLPDYWNTHEHVRAHWETVAARFNASHRIVPAILRESTGYQAFIAPEAKYSTIKTRALAFAAPRKALWKSMTPQAQALWYEQHKQPLLIAMTALKLKRLRLAQITKLGLVDGVIEIIAHHMARLDRKWSKSTSTLAPTPALMHAARPITVTTSLPRRRHPKGTKYSLRIVSKLPVDDDHDSSNTV